jgi:hypothetical protein
VSDFTDAQRRGAAIGAGTPSTAHLRDEKKENDNADRCTQKKHYTNAILR